MALGKGTTTAASRRPAVGAQIEQSRAREAQRRRPAANQAARALRLIQAYQQLQPQGHKPGPLDAAQAIFQQQTGVSPGTLGRLLLGRSQGRPPSDWREALGGVAGTGVMLRHPDVQFQRGVPGNTSMPARARMPMPAPNVMRQLRERAEGAPTFFFNPSRAAPHDIRRHLRGGEWVGTRRRIGWLSDSEADAVGRVYQDAFRSSGGDEAHAQQAARRQYAAIARSTTNDQAMRLLFAYHQGRQEARPLHQQFDQLQASTGPSMFEAPSTVRPRRERLRSQRPGAELPMSERVRGGNFVVRAPRQGERVFDYRGNTHGQMNGLDSDALNIYDGDKLIGSVKYGNQEPHRIYVTDAYMHPAYQNTTATLRLFRALMAGPGLGRKADATFANRKLMRMVERYQKKNMPDYSHAIKRLQEEIRTGTPPWNRDIRDPAFDILREIKDRMYDLQVLHRERIFKRRYG